jgi:membrane protein YqaA with SNARE-associated domain
MFEELFTQLANWGFFGLFLISLIGSSTVIFPLPAAAFVFGAGAVLNPLILGIVAGLGAALGELVGYMFGWGGRKISKEAIKDKLEKARVVFEKYGGFFALIIFAATPLPDDIVGIVGGTLNYDIKKFFIAVFIGKTIFNLGLAFAGHYGINGILNYLFKNPAL